MLIDDGFASTLPSFPEIITSRCQINLPTVQYFIVILSVCVETVFRYGGDARYDGFITYDFTNSLLTLSEKTALFS